MRPGESFDSNATFLRNPILRVKIMKNLLEQKIWRVATYSACAALFVSILLLLGCGGGTSSSSPNPLPNTTALQVNLGDAPSDRLVAVSMTIGSMTLTNGSGSSVTVVSSSTPVEMMHLMGTVEPISLMNVTQGTYSGASINLSSAVVLYMDPTTMQLAQKSVSGPMTATVNFNPGVLS